MQYEIEILLNVVIPASQACNDMKFSLYTFPSVHKKYLELMTSYVYVSEM